MPFDLYCRVRSGEAGNSHFLPLGDALGLRIAVACAAGVTLGGVAMWSAAVPSRVPLLVGAGLSGIVLLALPLRFFSTSRVLAVGGWTIVFGVAAVWREGILSPYAERLIVAGAAGGMLLALVATAAADETVNSHDGSRRVLALLLGSAVAVALYLLVLSSDPGVVSSEVSGILVDALLGLVGASLGLVALTGLRRGVHFAHYDPPVVLPKRLESPSVSRPSEPTGRPDALRSLPERLADAMSVVGARIAKTAADGCEALLKGAWWLLNLAIVAAVLARHVLGVWLTRARMALVLALSHALRELYFAAVAVGWAIRDWATTSILGIATLLAAAIMAIVACGWFEDYLVGGSLLYGPLGLVLAGFASAELVLLWWALTKWPLRQVGESAQHTSERAGPTAFLGLLLIGWIDGLAGVLGAGPIRPGLLTITGTVVLAIITYVYLGRRRAAP